MKKEISVCFFIDDITGLGGTERCVTGIASALSTFSSQCKVSVLSINAANKEIKYPISPMVEIVVFNNEKIDNKLKRRYSTYSNLKKYIMEKKYDVIIATDTYKTLCFVPFFGLMKRNNVKFVAWEHFNYHANKKYSLRWWARVIAAYRCDAVVVLGKEDCSSWKSNIGKVKNIRQIYNYVGFDMNKASLDNKNVLAVGRLEDQKGFDYLLDAWKIIEKDDELCDWKLQIVGDGVKKEELHLKADELGLEHVEWYSYTRNIEKFYKGASIYALSSRMEGFVLVLIEAQAFGLPIVSFNIKEGPKEIIDDGVNGFLIEPFDINLFAEGLKKLMKNPDLLHKFSDNSQKDMSRFSIDTVVKHWIELLDELTSA